VPWWRGKGWPLPPINSEAPRGGGTQHNSHGEVSSLLCATSLSSLSLLCGSSKGCVGPRSTPPLYAIVLRKFRIRSKLIYFRNLGWIRDPEVIVDHHMCAITRRCHPLWHRSRCTSIYMTLRSATSASSSTLVWERNPRIRSTRVNYRNLNSYNITNR
jgi:hypothetical protein